MQINVRWVLLAFAIFSPQLTWAESFTFTELDFPGAPYTAAYGIDNAGQIVGTASSSTLGQIGFLDTNGVFTTINLVPPGVTPTPYTIAYGVNNLSQVVGIGTEGPFLYADGIFTFIDRKSTRLN